MREIDPDPTVAPGPGYRLGIAVKNYSWSPPGQQQVMPVENPAGSGDYYPAGDDQVGVSGQGCTDPLSTFDNHAVVMYDGEIFDPSYGLGPYDGSGNNAGGDALLEWQRTSLDGLTAAPVSGGQVQVLELDGSSGKKVVWGTSYP